MIAFIKRVYRRSGARRRFELALREAGRKAVAESARLVRRREIADEHEANGCTYDDGRCPECWARHEGTV